MNGCRVCTEPVSQSLSENFHSMVGAEVTRLQMLWKLPGLAVDEVDLLTSTPTFQTRSQRDFARAFA